MRKQLLILISLFLFHAEAKNRVDDCKNTGASHDECLQKAEKMMTEKYGGLIKRNGKNLILKSLAGNEKDKILTDEKDIQYWAVEHFPKQSMSLISSMAWGEYSTAELYNHRTGVTTAVFDTVRFSKNGNFLVTFSDYLLSDYGSHGISVYQLSDYLQLQVQFENMNFAVSDASFITNNRIELQVHYYTKDFNKKTSICNLIHKNSIWQIENLECLNGIE